MRLVCMQSVSQIGSFAFFMIFYCLLSLHSIVHTHENGYTENTFFSNVLDGIDRFIRLL